MQSPGKLLLCRYHYDPLDRLISNALPNEPEHQRFYCKSRLATEIRGAMRYTIMRDDDQLLAQLQDDSTASSTTILITNQQHSVLDTLGANKQAQPITYAPYGFRPAASGLLSLLGFNGECPDPVTGCYLLGNGHRAFNPVLMRFNSPDSLSPFGEGEPNAYAYCSEDPINNYDPSGRLKLPSFMRTRRFASSDAATRRIAISETRTITETTINTRPDNSWTKAKFDISDPRNIKALELKWGNSTSVKTERAFERPKLRKANPSLYELALSTISEPEYQSVKKLDLIRPDKTFTKHNIFNRSQEISPKFDPNSRYNEAFLEAINNKIRGADPKHAKTLHEEWISNRDFKFR